MGHVTIEICKVVGRHGRFSRFDPLVLIRVDVSSKFSEFVFATRTHMACVNHLRFQCDLGVISTRYLP